MMTTLTITLPHTPRCLSPNAKVPLTQRGAIVAGYKKTAAKRRARTMAGAVTLEALKGHKMQPTQSWQYLTPEQAAILEQAACRDCPNCKYHDLLTKQSPCRDCYPHEDQRLWEPRKEGE